MLCRACPTREGTSRTSVPRLVMVDSRDDRGDRRCGGLERLERGRIDIFVANHESIYDIPVLFAKPAAAAAYYRQGLHLPIPIPGLSFSPERIRRSIAGARTARASSEMEALVGKGLSCCFFLRSRAAWTARSRRSRVVHPLAVESGLPIVPIPGEGSRFVMKKGRLMMCPGHVRLQVHDPIETAGVPAGQARALAERVKGLVAMQQSALRTSLARAPTAAPVS